MGKYSSGKGILAGGRLQTERERERERGENKEGRQMEGEEKTEDGEKNETQIKASSLQTCVTKKEKKTPEILIKAIFFTPKLCI